MDPNGNGTAARDDVCHQGSVPIYSLDVRTVEDIQAGLAFATEKGVRVVVKNTGHDYAGRSSLPDALQIWTHNLGDPMSYDEDFEPEGCTDSVGQTITMGAGAQWGNVYKFAEDRDLHIVGGTAPTVGAAGGWIAGGGFGPLAEHHGLGVDNVQELKVVLPTGKFVTANRCQNTDIFFALRGGGGGTFGVVTEMTTSVWDKTPMVYAGFAFTAMTASASKDLIRTLVENGDRWANEGWGGYAVPSASTRANPFVILMRPGSDAGAASETMMPLINFFNNLNDTGSTFGLGVVPSVYDIYSDARFGLLDPIGNNDELGTGGFAVAGRSVPRDNFKDKKSRSKLVNTIYDLMMTGVQDDIDHTFATFINIVAPSAYTVPESDQPDGPGASAIHPHWRNNVWDILHTRTWTRHSTSAEYVQRKFQLVHEAIQPLKKLTPQGSGSTSSPDILDVDDWPESLWGKQNYERLLKIKEEVDPQNIMTCWGCIGFEKEEEAFGCVPKLARHGSEAVRQEL